MARANRHFLPGCIWHITHRCHKRESLLKFARDRRPEWTESIGVGSESFLRAIKERLGIRAKGRKVVRGENRFELREVSVLYVDVFGVGNVDLSAKNKFFWRQSFKKLAS